MDSADIRALLIGGERLRHTIIRPEVPCFAFISFFRRTVPTSCMYKLRRETARPLMHVPTLRFHPLPVYVIAGVKKLFLDVGSCCEDTPITLFKTGLDRVETPFVLYTLPSGRVEAV